MSSVANRAYSNLPSIKLCSIEPCKEKIYFPRAHEQQINKIVFSDRHISIEQLMKYIHLKYNDTGLQYTIIHKLFQSTDMEISYYVPELVYIAIRKPCKPMKKLLVFKAKQNESLRRLILWNVKAFTVLMKQKDPQIKKQIEEFQENIVEKVKNKGTFNYSLKAIAMLTQASLTLKKMPPTSVLKEKLQKFIRRYNSSFLNNLKHQIIIPFRQQEGQNFQSNYVVNIVEDDCSCFPTRKRVPYRIIIETIDKKQLLRKEPEDKFGIRQKVEPDEQNDLYNQVFEIVEKMFTQNQLKILNQNIYPFVVDTEENKRFSQMKNFVNNLQKEEIKQQMMHKSRKMARKYTNSISQQGNFPRTKNDLSKYQIKPNENLKKFQAIYIPNISSDKRKSEITFNQLTSRGGILGSWQPRKRKSDKQNQDEHRNVKLYQQQIKEWNYSSESIWGQAWELKKVKFRQHSHFKHFQSLRLRNVVVKGGDDLRQQIICMQLIYKMRDIVNKAGVDVLIKPYEIIVLSQNSGILQFVSNSISVDQMKKKSESGSITKFFNDIFQTDDRIRKAKQNFVRSLAGSSILTYVLKLRDRHNGNILLDMEGNIIHIDFGFILGMAPGNINFQSSPFKLTAEYVQLMEGKKSSFYDRFCELFWKGMSALRKRVDELTLILQIMMEDSDLDCFKDFRIEDFKNRFKLHYSDEQFKANCENLIERSCMNSRTVHYDTFQYYSNGILP